MKSIITDDMDNCYLCGRPKNEVHHILRGTTNRKIADKYGLVIPLCHAHHDKSNNSVHHDKNLRKATEELAIKRFIEVYGEKKYYEEFKGRMFYESEDK